MLSTRLIFKTILLAVFMQLNTGPALADSMQEWESWILQDYPQQDCPWIMSKGNNRACIWPGKLALNANNEGGTFTYDVDVYENSAFIALPGSPDYWPTEVSVNGKPAPIVEANRLPHIAVSKGQHTVSGRFRWDKLPGQLKIPANVARVSLLVEGKSRIVDRRNGQLIFSSKSSTAQKQASDSLSLEVFRLLSDGVPITVSTHINLSVSGKPREVVFGSVMLADSEVLRLQSSFPARIEADGTMRAQVTPGEHTIVVVTRFTQSPTTITTKKLTPEWPEYEYMSFQSATAIRQAKLSGPISIDTSQISIPLIWEDFPTYRMSDGETLHLETEFRGDHSPAANELNVQRDLWLDFNGQGITGLDRISGQMNKGWRLNTAADTSIGRATVDNDPVLITNDGELEGIEVRSPTIDMAAVTRTESTSGFSALGWDARANQYNATLHLPPGWRVLHASGVDRVQGTWLSKWNLWDVFLTLIIISATRKLFGNGEAILAAGAFVVALHEPGISLLIIPMLLVVIALVPVVSGKLRLLLHSAGIVFSLVLVLSVISFAVGTFRLAIFPTLERSAIGTYGQSQYGDLMSGVSAPTAQLDAAMLESTAVRIQKPMAAGRQMEEVVVTANKAKQSLYQLTENDRVQTGPGLPTWTWNSVSFKSSGPVPADQTLSIYYSSPLITAIWRVLSAFLVAIYAGIVIARLIRSSQSKSTGGTSVPAGTAVPAGVPVVAIALMLLVAVSQSPSSTAQDYPPQYLLDTLEARLLKAPDCLPGCASLNDGKITVSGRDIAIQFSAYADADIALPLPDGHGSWALESVREAQQLLPMRKQNNRLFVRLPKGHHELTLKGKISGDNATISLPLALHNLVVVAPDWVVEGLINGRARNNTLTLRAIDENAARESDTLKPEPANPFVQVERHFELGQKWNVYTVVRRIAPLEGAISVPVKLVPDEKLLKDMGVVTEGEIIVRLGHRQQSVSWESSIEPTQQIQLTSGSGAAYMEQWSFTPSSLWRLNYQGIPPMQAKANAYAFEPVFKPWPGERLVVNIEKPSGAPGDTHTTENLQLEVDAGNKLQRSTLTMGIRSSLGTNHTIVLPEDSEVLLFSVNGKAMNTPSGAEVKIPLQPGLQSVVIEFQSLTDLGLISHSPAVRLPDRAANISIQYALPRDRWPLYISGPAIGPAMLYWGVLCVIVLGALVLPRLAKAIDFDMPIGIVGWLLLGVGLSTVSSYGVLVIAAMFFMLAARKQLVRPETMTRGTFNLMQCAIVAWVGFAVFCLLAAIPMGLLSNPEMKVVGNGSNSHFYNYYQDIVGMEDNFPIVSVVSVPIWAYRAVMLLWSLWLATQLIQWAGWGWGCITEKKSWIAKGKGGEVKSDNTILQSDSEKPKGN